LNYLIFILAIIIFIYPFFELYFLAKSVSALAEFSPELDNIFKNIGTTPTPNIREFLTPLYPSNIKNLISSKEKYYKYRKAFFIFIEYFISGIVLLILDILTFVLSIRNLSDDKLLFSITLCVMNLFVLWILKLSSVFHLIGLNKFAGAIDVIAFELFSPKGKFNNFIYNIAIKSVTYLFGLFTFFIYFKLVNILIKHFIPVDFIVVFFELVIYQYFVNKILSIFLSFIGKKSKFFVHQEHSKQYYFEIIKNTTYIVLLSLYIIYKYVQLLSGDSTYNSLLIESIGALFLLDTYFDKIKSITTPTTNEQMSQIIQIESAEENIMSKNKYTHSEDPITNQPQEIAEINISDTAINEYFNVVTTEYQIERSKKLSFETRSGLLLTLLSAICIFYFQSFKFTDIIALCSKPLTFLLFIKIISGILIYLSFIFTFISIIKTLAAKKHDNFEVKGINERLLIEDRKNAMARLIFTYRDIIIQHRLSNEKRAIWYKSSLYSTFILLISTIIYLSL